MDGHVSPLDDLIRTAIRGALEPEVRVDRVDVAQGEDHTGDPALYIEVYYETGDGLMDPRRTLDLSETLRGLLSARNDPRFPILTFVTWDEESPETARDR